MTNPLDCPIWFALTQRQREFARGDERAFAYRTDVEPFAAVRDDSEESLEAVAALCPEDDLIAFIQKDPIPPLPGLKLIRAEAGVQMIAATSFSAERPAGAEMLGDADAPEMLELALLTQPGPFRTATHRLGQFWGIRRNGRLIAMAGERMKLEGMTEVSGVCTHPDWRGSGLAAQLSTYVASLIQARGEIPFLHAFTTNKTAIRLYERLGFELRSEVAFQAFAHSS